MSNKWETLEHNGVLFPPEYEYKKIPVSVKGKEYILSAEAEEVMVMWASKYETPYINDKVFQKNYWNDFKTFLPSDLQNTKFPDDWDFSKTYSILQKIKEEKKLKTKKERDNEQKRKTALKEMYGYAKINGKKVPLANYVVEPPGLFMGRGDAPKRGSFKPRVRPEDVTINISKTATPPEPPKGRSWKKVVENKNALWTAMWIDRVMGRQKRILFSPVSFIRQGADQKKFSKAVVLAKNFPKVNEFIAKKLKSKDALTRELATACNIIAKMCIRVGDEKDEDEADTVGCSTLRVGHIKIKDSKVEFDFLGKDSIRYHNIVEFDAQTIANLQELCNGKKKDQQIFEHICSHDINEFLSIIIPGLTAKQFRTATGTKLLAEELRSKKIPKDMKDIKKIEVFNEANLEVAVKLNHQSAVSEAYDRSLQTMKNTLKDLKFELAQIKKEYMAFGITGSSRRDERIAFAKEHYTGTRQKESIKRAKDTFKKESEKYEKKLEKIKERVSTLETKIAIKEKTRGVALGTSRQNYSSPRIVFSWCKDNDIAPEKIYSKSLLEKFSWAADTDEEYYKKYPDVEE